MWREWLTRTLSPRRGPRERENERAGAPPELEGLALHPGADEFRAALEKEAAETE
jgi:hypothetical protein